MQNSLIQDINKFEVKRIVEEIYSKIRLGINSIDAADRVLVAIIKALVSLNNEPSSPRQLAACIQKYGFTQLGGQTPYATVSGHISTHFSRVRQQIVPKPIIGKQPHPAIAKRSLYYFLDPENILKNLLADYFPIGDGSSTYKNQLSPSSPTTNESIATTISENQYCAETPPSTPTSSVKDIVEEEDFKDDDENNYSDNEMTYKTNSDAAPYSDVKGQKKDLHDMGEKNEFTPPSSPNYLTFTPQITSRNPGLPRVPLNPDIRIIRLNGIGVYATKIKTLYSEITLLRRVDNNYFDKYSLLQAGGQRARNSDRKWITLEEAQTLASELNIERSLGIFLYERLSDYFDIELDRTTVANGCCYPFASWFQYVSPQKIFLE